MGSSGIEAIFGLFRMWFIDIFRIDRNTERQTLYSLANRTCSPFLYGIVSSCLFLALQILTNSQFLCSQNSVLSSAVLYGRFLTTTPHQETLYLCQAGASDFLISCTFYTDLRNLLISPLLYKFICHVDNGLVLYLSYLTGTLISLMM